MAQTKAADDYLLDALIKYALHLMTAGVYDHLAVERLHADLAAFERGER